MEDKSNNDGGGVPAVEFQEYKLGQDEELRFEVEGGKGHTIGVVVSSGPKYS